MTRDDHEVLSKSEAIDGLCERFEAAWRKAPYPQIGQWLAPAAKMYLSGELLGGFRGSGVAKMDQQAVRKLLHELVKIDIFHRWRLASEGSESAPAATSQSTPDDEASSSPPPLPLRPRLEDYVSVFPAMGPAEGLPLDLIAEEYGARVYFGGLTTKSGYVERFGERGGSLLRELDAVDRQVITKTGWPRRGRSRTQESGIGPRTVPLDRFIETLSQSGLMTAGQVQAFLDSLGSDEKPKTGEKLARLLVRRGKLSKFQARRICQGKTKGLVLGNYVVLESIGAGGMGQVYKARHRRMKRVVALKFLSSSITKKKEAVDRFQREVEAAARLVHQNIVVAHDADDTDGLHFLVMEYVDGGDLRSLVQGTGPLAVGQAVDYIQQAARALEYAHQKQVIHRDVKPANLLLDREGTIKLLDLGLARVEKAVWPEESTGSESLTQVGQIMGTIDFMAPEQAVDTKRAREPADVYSLGCTLFFLLTGRTLFPGATPMERIVAHREQPIPSLCELRSDVPESLDAVFRQMVAKRPEDRQASMTEVIAQLEACLPAEARQSGPWLYPQADFGKVDQVASAASADVPTQTRADDSSLSTGPPIEAASDRTTHTQPKLEPRGKRAILVGGLVTVVLVVVALAVVLRMRTPDGTLVLEISEPGAQVAILDEDGKVEIERSGEDGTLRISVDAGKHRLEVEKEGFKLYTDHFTIEAGGTKELEARLVPLAGDLASTVPPSRELSLAEMLASGEWEWSEPVNLGPEVNSPDIDAWADHLGVPVEQDVDLGNGVELTMMLIPPGNFMMGSTSEEQILFLEEPKAANEGPQHRVRITRPFRLGRHEVTVGQFRQFVEDTGYETDAERDGNGGYGRVDGQWVQDPRFVWNSDPGFEQTDGHPVVNVSWNDATALCQWLSLKEEGDFVLPSEAQWEYACRAGTTTTWHCGDDEAKLQEYAWFNVSSGGKTHPVGELLANRFGLCDMHGNVWEWCADHWGTDYYAQSPLDDPSGPPTGSYRVHRGGDWLGHAGYCRSATRNNHLPAGRINILGFRLAAVLAEE